MRRLERWTRRGGTLAALPARVAGEDVRGLLREGLASAREGVVTARRGAGGGGGTSEAAAFDVPRGDAAALADRLPGLEWGEAVLLLNARTYAPAGGAPAGFEETP